MELKSEKSAVQTLVVILKTVVSAVLITVILMGVLAVVICTTPLPEEAVTPSVYVLNYFSVFMAGLFSAAKAGKKGFMTGGLAGGLYMLAVYLAGYALFGGISFTREILMSIIYCIIVGMAGGIVGINVSRG